MLVGGSIGAFMGAKREFQEKWNQDKWGHAKVWTIVAGMVAVSQYVESFVLRGLIGLGAGYVLGRIATQL